MCSWIRSAWEKTVFTLQKSQESQISYKFQFLRFNYPPGIYPTKWEVRKIIIDSQVPDVGRDPKKTLPETNSHFAPENASPLGSLEISGLGNPPFLGTNCWFPAGSNPPCPAAFAVGAAASAAARSGLWHVGVFFGKDPQRWRGWKAPINCKGNHCISKIKRI